MLGNYAAGDTIDFKFTTRNSSGVPTALSGGTISVYKSNSTTESTSGVTLTASFDSVTGLNHVRIDTGSDGTFYATGNSFDVVITAGTVNSSSVVGEVVGRFLLGLNTVSDLTSGAVTDIANGLGSVTLNMVGPQYTQI